MGYLLSESYHFSLETSKQQVQIYRWQIELKDSLKIYKSAEIFIANTIFETARKFTKSKIE